MTRRDYVRIAAALNRARPDGTKYNAARTERGALASREGNAFAQWCRDVQAIADALATDNPRFDVGRFWDAADAEGEAA